MKMQLQLKAIVLGVAVGLIGTSATVYTPPAQAIVCATCATEWTQIMNNVQLVTQYAKQIQQYQAQLTSLANEAKNLASLPTSILGEYQQIYQQYMSTVQQLRGVMQNLDNVRDAFRQKYPDLANSNMSYQQLSAMSRQWETGGKQNIEDALANGASVLKSLQQAQSNFQQLGNASQSAGGALQAMQAGNQINMAVGQELMKLNTQMAVFQQAMLEQKAREMADDQVANERLKKAYSGSRAYQRSTAAPAPTLGGN